jgi:hypothetical protein
LLSSKSLDPISKMYLTPGGKPINSAYKNQ